MDIIKANFLHILGREPTDKELAHLTGLIKANNVREDDAFLTVMVIYYANTIANKEAIEHGKESIESVLSKAKESYNQAIKNANDSVANKANATIESVIASAINNISEKTAKELSKSANAVNRKLLFQWLSALTIVLAISHSSVYYFATKDNETERKLAWTQGLDHAMNELKDEKIRSEWANTPTGKKAYIMDKNNDLTAIIECSRDGWYKEKNKDKNIVMCFPHKSKEGQYGWIMP
jgi:hypothetical protein